MRVAGTLEALGSEKLGYLQELAALHSMRQFDFTLSLGKQVPRTDDPRIDDI